MSQSVGVREEGLALHRSYVDKDLNLGPHAWGGGTLPTEHLPDPYQPTNKQTKL